MTKAEEMYLENLIDNIRKMEEATKTSNNKNEIEKIKQYAIASLEDYKDTKNKICSVINKNKNIFPNPYIRGSFSGFIDGVPTTISNDTHNQKGEFEFKCGRFTIRSDNYSISALDIIVGGIHGIKMRTGYCGAWDDHYMETSNWIAEDIEVVDTTFSSSSDHPDWTKDLIDGQFSVEGEYLPYTIENLKKYNFSITNWVSIKNMAENTRKRTEELVKRFRMCLEYRIQNATEKLNKLENAANEEYEKVNF